MPKHASYEKSDPARRWHTELRRRMGDASEELAGIPRPATTVADAYLAGHAKGQLAGLKTALEVLEDLFGNLED